MISGNGTILSNLPQGKIYLDYFFLIQIYNDKKKECSHELLNIQQKKGWPNFRETV